MNSFTKKLINSVLLIASVSNIAFCSFNEQQNAQDKRQELQKQYDDYVSKAETYNKHFVVINNLKKSIECDDIIKNYIKGLDKIDTIKKYDEQLYAIQKHLQGLEDGKLRKYTTPLNTVRADIIQLKNVKHIGQYIKDLRDAAKYIKCIDNSAEQFCTLESGEKLPNLQNLYKLRAVNDYVNLKEKKPLRKKGQPHLLSINEAYKYVESFADMYNLIVSSPQYLRVFERYTMNTFPFIGSEYVHIDNNKHGVKLDRENVEILKTSAENADDVFALFQKFFPNLKTIVVYNRADLEFILKNINHPYIQGQDYSIEEIEIKQAKLRNQIQPLKQELETMKNEEASLKFCLASGFFDLKPLKQNTEQELSSVQTKIEKIDKELNSLYKRYKQCSCEYCKKSIRIEITQSGEYISYSELEQLKQKLGETNVTYKCDLQLTKEDVAKFEGFQLLAVNDKALLYINDNITVVNGDALIELQTRIDYIYGKNVRKILTVKDVKYLRGVDMDFFPNLEYLNNTCCDSEGIHCLYAPKLISCHMGHNPKYQYIYAPNLRMVTANSDRGTSLSWVHMNQLENIDSGLIQYLLPKDKRVLNLVSLKLCDSFFLPRDLVATYPLDSYGIIFRDLEDFSKEGIQCLKHVRSLNYIIFINKYSDKCNDENFKNRPQQEQDKLQYLNQKTKKNFERWIKYIKNSFELKDLLAVERGYIMTMSQSEYDSWLQGDYKGGNYTARDRTSLNKYGKECKEGLVAQDNEIKKYDQGFKELQNKIDSGEEITIKDLKEAYVKFWNKTPVGRRNPK